MNIVTPGSGWEAWRLELGLLNLLALVLTVVVLMAWSSGDPRRRWFVRSAGIAALLIAAVYGLFVQVADIPIEWITIIHEGQGYKHVLQLYVRATHAGSNFNFISWLAAGGAEPNLPSIVWFNLGLGMVNAALFLHLAVYVAGRAWGVIWTLVFALNPAAFLSAFSELPTGILALYFMAGVVGWVVLNDPAQARWARSAGLALCALLTVLVAMTRSEVALIGIVALGVYGAVALLGEERWAAGWRRAGELCARPLAFLAAHPGIVALLSLASIWLTWSGLIPGIGRSEVAGLYPFNPALFSIFIFLPMLLLPVGVSAGVFFGWVHALLDFRRFGGLALSLFILVRMYFAAQDQYYEAGRYLSYVFPALFFVALFGKPRFDLWTAQWRAPWRQLAQVLFVMAWFTRPLPGIPDFYQRPEFRREDGFTQVLLDRNSQRILRHMVKVTRDNPDCVFVTRVVENFGRRDQPREYAYAFFGGPVPQPVFVSERTASLDEAIARVAPGAACVRLYYGTDCNLTENDRCPQFIAGRRLIEEERFWSRLYDNPYDYGYAAGDVVLGVYAWP